MTWLQPRHVQDLSTIVYASGMPEEAYVFTLSSYDRLAEAAIDPLAVRHVLSRPVVRRHIGAVLTVAGRDHHGRWLSVALIEGDDDQYEVVGARYLDADEIAVIQRIQKMRGDQ